MIDLPYLQITGRNESEKINQLIAYNKMLRDSLDRVLSCIDTCNLSAPLAEKINGIKDVDLKEYVKKPELSEYAKLSQIPDIPTPTIETPAIKVVAEVSGIDEFNAAYSYRVIEIRYKTYHPTYGEHYEKEYVYNGNFRIKVFDHSEPSLCYGTAIPTHPDYPCSDNILTQITSHVIGYSTSLYINSDVVEGTGQWQTTTPKAYITSIGAQVCASKDSRNNTLNFYSSHGAYNGEGDIWATVSFHTAPKFRYTSSTP